MPEQILGPYGDPLLAGLNILGGPVAVQHNEALAVQTLKVHAGTMKGRWVTGLKGRLSHPLSVKEGNATRHFAKGEQFLIRWDYDPAKGAHVNLAVGNHNAYKAAIKTNSQDRYRSSLTELSQAITFSFDHPQPHDGQHLADYWVNRYTGPPPNWTAQIRRTQT